MSSTTEKILTKVTSDTPIAYNDFDESNCNDHNSFTELTIMNAKSKKPDSFSGIIAKVVFNGGIVHEDRYLMAHTTMASLANIQSKYPGRKYPLTSCIIVPPGYTMENALRKLSANNLMQISTAFDVLVFTDTTEKSKETDEKKEVDTGDDTEGKIHNMQMLAQFLCASECTNVNNVRYREYDQDAYVEWKAFYDKEKSKLDGDNSFQKGFIERLLNFSDYTSIDDRMIKYDKSEALKFSMFMSEQMPIHKVSVRVSLDKNGDDYDELYSVIKEHVDNNLLSITDEDYYTFTIHGNKPDAETEETAAEKQQREFYEMMNMMGKQMFEQFSQNNPDIAKTRKEVDKAKNSNPEGKVDVVDMFNNLFAGMGNDSSFAEMFGGAFGNPDDDPLYSESDNNEDDVGDEVDDDEDDVYSGASDLDEDY